MTQIERRPPPPWSMRRKVISSLMALLGAVGVTLASNWLVKAGSAVEALADVPATLRDMKAAQQMHADTSAKYERIAAQYLCVIAAPTEHAKQNCILRAIQ